MSKLTSPPPSFILYSTQPCEISRIKDISQKGHSAIWELGMHRSIVGIGIFSQTFWSGVNDNVPDLFSLLRLVRLFLRPPVCGVRLYFLQNAFNLCWINRHDNTSYTHRKIHPSIYCNVEANKQSYIKLSSSKKRTISVPAKWLKSAFIAGWVLLFISSFCGRHTGSIFWWSLYCTEPTCIQKLILTTWKWPTLLWVGLFQIFQYMPVNFCEIVRRNSPLNQSFLSVFKDFPTPNSTWTLMAANTWLDLMF